MKIGVIADTHGLTRPEALEALRGSDLILHAGDIGKPTVIEALQAIASVVAVRGNIDNGPWANSFADTEVVQAESVLIYMLHDLAELDLDPRAAKIGVVVSGHSHIPIVETRRVVPEPGQCRTATLPAADLCRASYGSWRLGSSRTRIP
jgi:uncharacterized protein